MDGQLVQPKMVTIGSKCMQNATKTQKRAPPKKQKIDRKNAKNTKPGQTQDWNQRKAGTNAKPGRAHDRDKRKTGTTARPGQAQVQDKHKTGTIPGPGIATETLITVGAWPQNASTRSRIPC